MFASNQKVAKIDACLKIAGLKIDGAQQFPISRHNRSLLQKNLRQLIVCFGKVAIHLESVGELDGRLLQFALIGVAFAAFKVALLLLVGIAMTTQAETKCERQSQDCRGSK